MQGGKPIQRWIAIWLFIWAHTTFMQADDCPPCVDSYSQLMRDLEIVNYWNCYNRDYLPVTYNHLLHGGYINMPSARMGKEGELGFGYSDVKPYRIWSGRCQLTDRLEVSGNYRIFTGIDDPILSPHGFGDLSDKGADIKFALFHPEDSDYRLPGVAIGFEDFMGTRSFRSRYIVLTKVLPNYDMEMSVGYGQQRINGWFGGISWMPFRRCGNSYLEGLSLVAEFDATHYRSKEHEPHPDGRSTRSAVNLGAKYRLWDYFDFSLSWIRGEAWAGSISAFYNFGETKGFVPKLDDVLPYQAPKIVEPIGPLRPEHVLAQDLAVRFCEQGLDLYEAALSYNACGEKLLRLRVYNTKYRLEPTVRCRLNHLLAGLIPGDIEQVIVVIDSDGFPIQEYHYNMDFVRSFGCRSMGPFELRVLSPLKDVTPVEEFSEQLIYYRPRKLFNWSVLPKTHTLFGSATGKFKYAIGFSLGADGYLYNDIYYNVRFGYTPFSDLKHCTGVDRLNPSQLINVRTDIVLYYKNKGVTLDEAYLQRTWNLGCGLYGRVALGYFEEEYAGLASEVLYYPMNSDWAIGLEGAVFRKRAYSGLGFTDVVRKYDGFKLTFRKHFIGSQYFCNLYYDWKCVNLDLRIKAGKFLANDWGSRFEVSRYFPSGLRVTLWYTWTNGKDEINGDTYHDKGIALSMPLDIFYTYSSRNRWEYGMSAWLRDVGVSAATGQELYYLINNQRQGMD